MDGLLGDPEKDQLLKDIVKQVTAEEFCKLKWDSMTFGVDKSLIHVHRYSYHERDVFDIKYHQCPEKKCFHSLCNNSCCDFHKEEKEREKVESAPKFEKVEADIEDYSVFDSASDATKMTKGSFPLDRGDRAYDRYDYSEVPVVLEKKLKTVSTTDVDSVCVRSSFYSGVDIVPKSNNEYIKKHSSCFMKGVKGSSVSEDGSVIRDLFGFLEAAYRMYRKDTPTGNSLRSLTEKKKKHPHINDIYFVERLVHNSCCRKSLKTSSETTENHVEERICARCRCKDDKTRLDKWEEEEKGSYGKSVWNKTKSKTISLPIRSPVLSDSSRTSKMEVGSIEQKQINPASNLQKPPKTPKAVKGVNFAVDATGDCSAVNYSTRKDCPFVFREAKPAKANGFQTECKTPSKTPFTSHNVKKTRPFKKVTSSKQKKNQGVRQNRSYTLAVPSYSLHTFQQKLHTRFGSNYSP